MTGRSARARLRGALLSGRLPAAAMFPAGDDRFHVHFARLDSGLTVRVVECGEAAAPPVLCIHGWACSAFTARWTMLALARRGLRAIAPDMPGSGLSDKPSDPAFYQADNMVSAIGEIMDALELDRAALAGHSLGAALAARYALRAPERLSALALLAPVGFGSALPLRTMRYITPEPLAGVIPYLVPRWTVAPVLRMAYGEIGTFSRREVDEYWAPTQFPEFTRGARQLLHTFPWDSGEELGLDRLRARTGVMVGTRDHLAASRAARRYAALIPGARLVIVPRAGHLLPAEVPERVAQMIADTMASSAGVGCKQNTGARPAD